MKVFLDSSFLIALIIDNDKLHEKAIELKEKGLFNNECYISNLIINEVITVIGNKTSLKIAEKSYSLLNDLFFVLNEYEIKDFNNKTMNTYLKFNTKLSFTDSAIIEIMKYHNITTLVSFDKYFKKSNEIKLLS